MTEDTIDECICYQHDPDPQDWLMLIAFIVGLFAIAYLLGP